MRKFTGYSLLSLSCIAFAILPVIPFLPFTTSEKVAYSGSVFIFAEITWWVGLPLIGREAIEFCKQCWQKCKSFFKQEI